MRFSPAPLLSSSPEYLAKCADNFPNKTDVGVARSNLACPTPPSRGSGTSQRSSKSARVRAICLRTDPENASSGAIRRSVKKGRILVSVVSPKPQEAKRPNDVRMAFFIVEVATARLDRLTALFDRHALKAQVGSVLSLEGVRVAHEMVAGAPRKGK